MSLHRSTCQRTHASLLTAALVLTLAAHASAQVTSYAYVTLPFSDQLVVVDTRSRTIVGTPISVGFQPRGVQPTPDGRRVYVTRSTMADVVVLDAVTKALVGSPITVGFAPFGLGLTPDGRKLYVANSAANSNSISAIDTGTDTPITTFPAGGSSPNTANVSPDGQRLVVPLFFSDQLALFDTTTDTMIGTPSALPGCISPAYVIFTLDGQRAYVPCVNSLNVAIVDLAAGTVIGTIDDLPAPRHAVLTRDGSRLLLGNNFDTQVRVIDTATNVVSSTVTVGLSPLNVDLTPDGATAFTLDSGAAQMSVFDAATLQVLGTIPLPGTPSMHTRFIGPNIITTACDGCGPLEIANDAALDPLGFGRFVNFDTGILSLTGPWITNRTLSILAGGGTIAMSTFNAVIAGPIINDGLLTKTGDGALTLNGESTHAGGTTVLQGWLIVNASHAGAVRLQAGTLGGVGTIAAIEATGGSISPGTIGPAILRAGAVTMTPDVVFYVDVDGMTAGTGHDQLDGGSVALGGATLEVNLTYTPAVGDSFTIVKNATGTFAGLPEGTPFVANGRWLRVTYRGGAGSDVVLTADGPPSIAGLTNQTMLAGQTLGPIPFTVGDDLTPVDALIVTATSSNQALLPDAAIVLGGGGAARTLTATPVSDASGTTMVTVRVSDGGLFAQRTFTLTVDGPPSIAGLTDQTIRVGDTLGPIAFTVGDDRTPPDQLTVTATSSNDALLPSAVIVLGGGGGSRTLTAMPVPGVSGTTLITVTVSDGAQSAAQSFTLTVRPLPVYYLAEGATGVFFNTDLLLANPHATDAPVIITFYKDDGTTIEHAMTLPASSRTTLRANEIAGLEAGAFSTSVSSTDGLPLVVERTMWWDASGYGMHTEKAGAAAASTWYFAEGAQGFFHTYFLLLNPHPVETTAHVTYLVEGGPAVQRAYPIGARSRLTIDAGAEPALAERAFGAVVTFDLPGMAERAMYFGDEPLFSGGHAAAGVTTPATDWFLAEGATGTFFDTFVLIANPNDDPAALAVTYLTAGGTPIVATHTLPGRQRLTLNVAEQDAALANTAVSTRVESDRPVIVERAQYWPHGAWYEAHASAGETAAGTSWGLAEGRVGGATHAQTFILIANPGAAAADLTVTFLRESGAPIVKQFTAPAASRFTIAITGAISGADGHVPELADEAFAATIVSTQPVIVERAMYADAGGVTWAAGTAATATRLP